MLRTQLSDALKTAMKSKEAGAVSTLRLILAALKDRDIAARSKGNTEGIGDDEILGLLQQMVKQRRESIDMYEQGGRPELAEKEGQEITIIERFLPTQLDEAAVGTAVRDVIAETGAANLKDMGKVMTALRERYAGQMDFGKASAIAKQQLS
jgi:uncharacterized protein YqeY